MKIGSDFNVSKRKLKGLLQDGEKSAEVINLVYVSDKDPGIERVRGGEVLFIIKMENELSIKWLMNI